MALQTIESLDCHLQTFGLMNLLTFDPLNQQIFGIVNFETIRQSSKISTYLNQVEIAPMMIAEIR
jgi:hypothetical protein